MELAVITDEVSQDLARATIFAQEFGLHALEIRSVFGVAFKDLSNDQVKRIRDECQAADLRIIGCASPVLKCELSDRMAVAAHTDVFKRSLEIATTLGAPMVRVFTGLRDLEAPSSALIPKAADCVWTLCQLAEGSGIQIAIENEASCVVATPQELRGILSLVPNPSVGALWDPCNVLYVDGTLPLSQLDLVPIANRIIHVHVKDARRMSGRGPKAVPVGLGDVGWRDQLQALRAIGYNGRLGLETHWRVKGIDESLLHLPAGNAFSEGGEEASRVCLHNLRELVD